MDLKRAVLTATLALLALPSIAAQRDPACSEQAQELAGSFLQANAKRRGSEDDRPAVSSACKPWPGKEPYTLAVFVYEGIAQDSRRILVTLLDQARSVVVASYWATVPSDAIETYSEGIRIDTGRYQVQPGLRAFGVDFNTSEPRYQYGGYGPMRTLFVREGKTIRPILSGMAIASWRLLNDPWEKGAEEDGAEPEIERFSSTIAIAATRSKGYADLLVTRKSDQPGAKPTTQLLHYDGRQYPTPQE
jgi:hypothetical protein